MTPNSIKALLKLRGLEYDDILERMKTAGIKSTKFELSKIINGDRATRHQREAFAAALGMDVSEIFDNEFEAVVAYQKSA